MTCRHRRRHRLTPNRQGTLLVMRDTSSRECVVRAFEACLRCGATRIMPRRKNWTRWLEPTRERLRTLGVQRGRIPG